MCCSVSVLSLARTDTSFLAEPTDIVTEDLTTILYSFADIAPDNGTILLTDIYADEQVRLPCCQTPNSDQDI